MPIRIDASGDYLTSSTLSVSDDAFTICGWFYLTVDRNASGLILELANAGGTRYKAALLTSTGTLLSVASSDFTSVTGTNLSLATWYHIALVANGTATTVYLNGVQDATTTDAVAVTTYTLLLSGSNTISFINGRIHDIKMWSVALTATEILQEMQTIRPQRIANLYGWWPTFPGATERARDYSGNGHDLTEVGTLTDEDPPPVSWGDQVRPVVAQPASGTDVTVTPSQLLLTASLLTPTVSAVQNPTITPGLLTLTSSLFTPTVTAGGNVTVSPALLTLTASLLQAFVTMDTTDLAEDGTVSEDVSVEILTATASHRLPLLGVG